MRCRLKKKFYARRTDKSTKDKDRSQKLTLNVEGELTKQYEPIVYIRLLQLSTYMF